LVNILNKKLISRLTFSMDEQHFFVDVSGDRNPIHIDPIAARRSQAGGLIVHGVHTFLRVLDCYAKRTTSDETISRIKTRFNKPVLIDDTVSVFDVSTSRRICLRVEKNGLNLASIVLEKGSRHNTTVMASDISATPVSSPRDIPLTEIAKCAGAIPIPDSAEAIKTKFPNAVEWLGIDAILNIVGLSTLVGMECPGLHSLFSGFDVNLRPEKIGANLLYRVNQLQERYRLTKISVECPSLYGTVEAFVRIPPVKQTTVADLCQQISPDEFVGQKALIIGGSRGLGALTAKIIAAGGGHPFITYAVGKLDAIDVVEEIVDEGKTCGFAKYDVHQPARPQLNDILEDFSHMYYYASPQIFRRKTAVYEPDTAKLFNLYFADAFSDLCYSFSNTSNRKITIFYPSTTAIDERPGGITEYTMAKVAGEILCEDISMDQKNLEIITRRLPRVHTDQTANVASTKAENPLDILLPILRQIKVLSTAG
jgi:hypothetical protein